jgi:hypothetical protein
MNPNQSHSLSHPELELDVPSAEKWAVILREERRRLHEDQETLREREQNLRKYEAKLRSLQDEIQTGRTQDAAETDSSAAFAGRPHGRAVRGADDPNLQAAWDKLHRARELLQAEQDHLSNDRNFLRELELSVKQREEALAVREARVAEREARLLAGPNSRPAAPEDPQGSAVARLTLAPFNMARSMLGGKK